MATIAKTSILMSLNAAGLVSGLRSAHGQVQSFGSSIASVGKLVGAAGLLFGGVATVGGLYVWGKATIAQIDRLDELSIKTGISTEALSRLGYAAKFSSIDTETLADSIVKMEKLLSESQGKPSILSSLGLDAKKLAAENPDKAFLDVSQAIAAIPNPMDRAAAAIAVFGKTGANLLPMLTNGKAGIGELMDEADKLGVTIGTKDAIQVAALADSLDRMAAVGQGAMNQVIIQAAPFVTAILTSITDWLKSTPGTVYGVTYAFETVLESIATAADYLQLLGAGFKYAEAIALASVSREIDALGALAAALNYVAARIPGLPQINTKLISQLSDSFSSLAGVAYNEGDAAYAQFANGANAAKVHAFFDSIRAGADKAAAAQAAARAPTNALSQDLAGLAENAQKIDDIMKKLTESVDEFGLSESEKTLKQLEGLHASDAQIAKAKELTDELDRLNAVKKMDDDAAKIREDILTPAEKAKAEIEKIHNLFDAGKLSWTEYGKAIDKIQSANVTPTVSAPELFEAGSQQSQRLMLDLQRGTGLDKDPWLKLTKETETQTTVLRDIRKSIKAPSDIVAVKLS